MKNKLVALLTLFLVLPSNLPAEAKAVIKNKTCTVNKGVNVQVFKHGDTNTLVGTLKPGEKLTLNGVVAKANRVTYQGNALKKKIVTYYGGSFKNGRGALVTGQIDWGYFRNALTCKDKLNK